MAAPRPASDLKPTDERAKLLKKLKQDKLRADAEKLRQQAKEQAASKKVQPAKDVDHRRTRTSSRAEFLREAKKGNIKAAKMPAADLKPGDARSKFLKSAQDGTIKAAKGSSLGRAIVKKIPVVGTAAGFIADATPLNKGETEFMEMIKKKAGKGYGDKPVGPFRPTETRRTFGGARPERPGSYPKANRQAAGTVTAPYEPKRGTAGTYTQAYDVKTKKAAPAATAAPKAASDKSRAAPKMTSFQRMKARQFEKEGVAGRSMTRSAAQKKAMERSGGFASLFSRKPASKPMSAGKTKAQLAAEFRAKQQGLRKK
jgi:hypothetical protein